MSSGERRPEDNMPSELRFTVDGSLTLVADAWGDRENPPVVLLHGGGQTRHAWSGTAATLAAAGWYAVAVDQRGHGESDWAPDGNYDRERYADDVTELAAELPSPPVLVGASLGGMASLLSIHRAETEVTKALVLVDIATRWAMALALGSKIPRPKDPSRAAARMESARYRRRVPARTHTTRPWSPPASIASSRS